MLRQLAQGGAQFIIAHASGYDTIANRIAQQYNVPTITYDVPTNLKKGQLSYVTTSSQEGAYLAGILAAHTTKTHKVGIIISASDDNWYKMSGGFAAGFRSIDKTSKIYFATISPTGYDDAAGGKRVAQSIIAQGADVIFAMGDDASFGYLQAISTAKAGHKVWYIGDIGDMTPIDKQHVLLSSVLWNFTGVFSQAIKDINNGTYGTHGLQPEPVRTAASRCCTRSTSRPACGRRSRRRRRRSRPGRSRSRSRTRRARSRSSCSSPRRERAARPSRRAARSHDGFETIGERAHTRWIRDEPLLPTRARRSSRWSGSPSAFPASSPTTTSASPSHRGEVQCLLGENGAGKSTLIGILSGLVRPDAGTIKIDGAPAPIDSPRAALELGIGTVYQHSALIPALTVLENLMLGDSSGAAARASPAARARLAELAASLGVEVDPGDEGVRPRARRPAAGRDHQGALARLARARSSTSRPRC